MLARNQKPDIVSRLEAELVRQKKISRSDDGLEWVISNMDFHLMLVVSVGNPLFDAAMPPLASHTMRIGYRMNARRQRMQESLQEHTALDAWPVDTASQDAVLALSAAHEIRNHSRRASFFKEAKRVLRSGGRVVVVEQLRDLPNFLCFGIAAFHFLSRRTWLRSFRDSGLIVEREFAITPFMRAFVLH
jgi:SAM-dependent methyltransferase